VTEVALLAHGRQLRVLQFRVRVVGHFRLLMI
jgi:hypothetical protein